MVVVCEGLVICYLPTYLRQDSVNGNNIFLSPTADYEGVVQCMQIEGIILI